MLAHDVSGQSGSIIEQIAALKISNIAVGKQIADLLGGSSVPHGTSAPENVEFESNVKLIQYCSMHSMIVVTTPSAIQFWSLNDGFSNTSTSISYFTQYKLEPSTHVRHVALIQKKPLLNILFSFKKMVT